MTDNDRTGFQAPTSTAFEKLIQVSLDNLTLMVRENKRDIHGRLDTLQSDLKEAHGKISSVKEKVDTLGLEYIIGDVKRQEERMNTFSERVKKLENYHNRIMAIGSFIGFVLAVALGVVQMIKWLS